jgi:Flp pilus assembly pilin Flp
MYQFLQDERGTAAIEYSLFISLIGLVVAGALHVLGANLVDAFSLVSEALPSIQVTEDPQNKGLFMKLFKELP